MAEVIKIVLTGGPCAGKSSAMEYVSSKLESLGIATLTIEETATKLILSGKTPENMGNYEFHKLLFETQLKEETQKSQQARSLDCERAVLLIDRGLLDNRVFVTQNEFDRYCGLNGLNEDVVRNSYDAVFHLVTAANGAEEHYNLSNNEARGETPAQARTQDEELLAVWTGTPHLRIIDNSTDFQHKLERLMREVTGFLGLPEPFEIERKFLIEYPNLDELNKIKTCRRVPITQAYLNTPEEGNFRIRKRGEGDFAVYIKTVKIKISDIKRIEIENYISKEEYLNYISQKENISGIISKDRYCIAYNSTYYELDVYPFWQDKATIEIELLAEDESFSFPPFVKLIREVSAESEYRNFALAQKYRNLF
jgi:CYTH domain-containing protein/predicted ATPase